MFNGDSEHDFAVIAPGGSGGSLIAKVGWRKPYIVARSDEGERPWEVFDTSKRTSRLLTEKEFRADPVMHDIPVVAAEDAWNKLRHYRSQW